MPIDKFTTDKYVGQEEELLEYVTVIADKFKSAFLIAMINMTGNMKN